MPKHLIWYRNQEKMRTYKNRQKKINYDNGGFVKAQFERREPFSDEEDWWVLYSKLHDREIAETISRSVRSIQIRRSRLKHDKVSRQA